MSSNGKKRFFASHAKSSAAMISIVIHALLLVLAFTFVAVTVIVKEDKTFEAKPVERPKMQLKKLQAPIKMEKKRKQAPKLRKRIVVKPKLNQKAPDIKMPEITGVKGGLGNSAGDGLGGGGGVGFSMPEIELFGVKGKGEKVFIILDATPYMMVDEIGGIPAYEIIKSELVRILEGLNPAVLFNIAVFDNHHVTLFPNLVQASDANVEKVKKWLAPLNSVKKGMGDKDYGTRTLGPGGTNLPRDLWQKPLRNDPGHWVRASMVSMKQQADMVFVLSCRWGHISVKIDEAEQWSEAKKARWRQAVATCKTKHREENARRRAKGDPPRVIAGGDRGLVATYMPGEPRPPTPKYHHYSPKEIIETFNNIRKKHKPRTVATSSGLGKKEKYTVNVIYFAREDKGINPRDKERFDKLTSLTRGDFKAVKGMKAIQGYAARSSE